METRDEILARLAARGLVLPTPPKPGGAYEPVRVLGSVGYVAIQFPVRDGVWLWQGRLGRELSTEDGYQAAEACALNVLAQIDAAVGFERLAGLNRFEAYLQTVEGWDAFPRVLDGASHLFLEALGEAGKHSRAPLGIERLSKNAPIALVATFTLRE